MPKAPRLGVTYALEIGSITLKVS